MLYININGGENPLRLLSTCISLYHDMQKIFSFCLNSNYFQAMSLFNAYGGNMRRREGKRPIDISNEYILKQKVM